MIGGGSSGSYDAPPVCSDPIGCGVFILNCEGFGELNREWAEQAKKSNAKREIPRIPQAILTKLEIARPKMDKLWMHW